MDKLKLILNNEVIPILRLHGGDLELVSFENKEFKFKLLGACNGCPSAQITIEDLIDKKLKDGLGKDIEKVTLISEVDIDMLNFAKKLLK